MPSNPRQLSKASLLFTIHYLSLFRHFDASTFASVFLGRWFHSSGTLPEFQSLVTVGRRYVFGKENEGSRHVWSGVKSIEMRTWRCPSFMQVAGLASDLGNT
jgi:hypothetical protein